MFTEYASFVSKKENMTFKTQHLSISINEEAQNVYDFIRDLNNLSRWATGIDLEQVDVRFVERNEMGVLDHYILLGDGKEVYIPMRVFPNGKGCEVTISVTQRPGKTDNELYHDALLVKHDLEILKSLIEYK